MTSQTRYSIAGSRWQHSQLPQGAQTTHYLYDDKGHIRFMTALYDQLLQDTLGALIKSFKISTLVEFGCGTGINLFKLSQRNNIKKIIGGDICPNAVKLGQEIATQCHINAEFSAFDYYKKDDIQRLVGDVNDPYIIFTSHSIEQIQINDTSFIEQIAPP